MEEKEELKIDSGRASDELRDFLNRNSRILTPVLVAIILLAGVMFFFPSVGIILPIMILALFCLSLIYRLSNFSVGTGFIRKFAKDNGFSYSAKGSTDGLDGLIFQIGTDNAVSDFVSGKVAGLNMTFFVFEYKSDLKESDGRFYVSVFKFDIGSDMPHLFVKNFQHGFAQPTVGVLDGLQNIELEGDFNKYFKVQTEAGSEMEALEIFTPDVMADFVDKGKLFGLEIVDRHLYIYKPRLLRSGDELDELFSFAKRFVEKKKQILKEG